MKDEKYKILFFTLCGAVAVFSVYLYKKTETLRRLYTGPIEYKKTGPVERK